MKQSQLTLTSLLESASKLFPLVETVSRRPDDWLERSTYGNFYASAQLTVGKKEK